VTPSSQGPTTYSLDHVNSTVELTISGERFLVRTQGKGLLDRPRIIDIPPADVVKFCLVPTIAAQNIVGETVGRTLLYDTSYDSELVFSYKDQGQLKKKRVFVNGKDETFRSYLDAMKAIIPGASLLHLPPEQAIAEIGVVSGRQGLWLIIGLLVGLPTLIVVAILVSLLLRKSP